MSLFSASWQCNMHCSKAKVHLPASLHQGERHGSTQEHGWTTAMRRSPITGLPDNQLSWLQCVLNAAARLIFSARKYESVSPLLRDLHWLRVLQLIEFKLTVLTCRCLHSTALPYLADELHRVAHIDTMASEVGIYINTRCTTDAPLHHWRLLISGCGFSCMEQSAV